MRWESGENGNVDDQVWFMKFVFSSQPNKQRDIQEPCTNSRRCLEHELSWVSGLVGLVGTRVTK